MNESFDESELRGLLDALVEGDIAPAQMQRLETLVLGRPEAEAYYVQYLSMVADLQRRLAPAQRSPWPTEPRERPASEARVDQPRARMPLLALIATGLAAALLLGLLGLWRSTTAAPALEEPEPIDDSVAILVYTSGAEWEDTGMPTRTGTPLPPGRLSLKAGVAQIEFYSGATVILEGPAEFHLKSATQAYCARGKLRATVPPQAQGFAIGSPKVDLVDRGTEFGMSVGDRTEVHVFRGMVELYDPAAATGGQSSPARPVQEGAGVRRDGMGAYESIPVDSAAFVTAQDLAVRSEADTRRRQRDWRAAGGKLREDATLALYYPFESDGPWDRTLRDRSASAEPRYGAIVGCQWNTSRWPGKQGLEFKRVSDRVRLHVPGEFASLTLVAWVRVDALSNSFNSLMMADAWEEGGVHWHINAAGEISLGIQGPNKRGGTDYRTPRIYTPERLGQWAQLAVVYDAAERKVTHYVDGKPVRQDGLRFDVPLRIGDCELGNWNVGSRRDRQPIRNLSGCLDEFLLYKRALSAADIQRLYEMGRQ